MQEGMLTEHDLVEFLVKIQEHTECLIVCWYNSETDEEKNEYANAIAHQNWVQLQVRNWIKADEIVSDKHTYRTLELATG